MSRWFNTYGFAEVSDHLLVGAFPGDPGDVRRLAAMGVTKVLNLVEDDEYERGARTKVAAALAAAGIEEHRVHSADYGNIDEDVLEEATSVVGGWLDDDEVVYLHCRAGWQRSAAVAAGVVAIRDGVGLDEALSRVQARKPTADPLPHQLDDLSRWWRRRSAARL